MAGELAGFADHAPPAESFREALTAGLARRPKKLPSKFIYDERGSQLFDAILDRPEYYIPRVEMDLLRAHAQAIADVAGPGCALIDYGSGSMAKARILLRQMASPAVYVPLDISAEHLLANARLVAAEFPALPVFPVCADFLQVFPLPDPARAARSRLGFFPGSTIGNMTDEERLTFLRRSAEQLQGGGLLIGVDLKKDAAILRAAYNDAAGASAAFNTNILWRANRELGADFDVAQYRHRAEYNAAAGRMEIGIESLAAQTVRLAGREFRFGAGEIIDTQWAYKFTVEEFQALGRQSGFEPRQAWVDDKRLFSIHYLRAP
ncbi:MAG TPA: L-histidine N(alpha)-methyltransferase [Dongiaceae bacterium]